MLFSMHFSARGILFATLFSVLIASRVAAEPFEIRLVHPSNDAIVSSKVESGDLSNYEKLILKQHGKDEVLWVNKKVELNIHDLKNAKAQFPKPPFLPMVALVFTENGAKKLSEFSSRNRKQRVAIILDGRLLIAPVIFEPLTEGRAAFSGDYKPAEIQSIADRINEVISKTRTNKR